MSKYLQILILFICLASPFDLMGQRELPAKKSTTDKKDLPGQNTLPDEFGEGQYEGDYEGVLDSLEEDIQIELPDTAIIDFSFFDNIHRIKPYGDTILGEKSQFYDPARIIDPLHAHLGNVGSAAWSLAFKEKRDIGLKLGYDQYDIYQIKKDSFRLYRVNRPVTSVFFMPSGNQQNFIINTKFARNFANDINVSLDYQRIKQPGVYKTQSTKSTYVGAAIWYKGPSKKYDFIISVTSNSNNEEHNGGVSDKTLFNEPFYNYRERIPTYLSEANTRLTYRNYSVNNYFHLVKKEESPWKFSLRHELSYIRQGYKSFDEDLSKSSDQNYYGPLFTDERGLRNRMSIKNWQNSFFLILNNGENFNAQTCISFANNTIDLDGNKFSKRSLQAHFNGDWSLKKSITLKTQLDLGLLDYIGDINLSAEIALKTKTIGILKGKFHFNRSSPSMIHQELYLSQTQVWKNDYTKPILSAITAEYQLPSIGLIVGLSQTLIEKPLYFDFDASSTQLDGTLSISAARVDENIKIGIFHLDNRLQYQRLNNKIYPLPEWFSTHSLYIKKKIFKQQMLLKTGLDTRVTQSYNLPAYMPITGQFYLQNEDIEELFFLTDFFINFKISNFHTFIRLENITDFIGNRVFYQINDYPQFDFRIKLGVTWSLFD